MPGIDFALYSYHQNRKKAFRFMQKFTIAVHGGAGTIFGSLHTAALEADYKMALQEAILSD